MIMQQEREEEARRKMEGLKVEDECGVGKGRRGGKTVVNVEEPRPGGVAATVKASDQMSGQTFNDVGRLGDEGNIYVERRVDDGENVVVEKRREKM